ncbi:dehydrodolichyl diphosphate synthase complex subunit nus1-like [Actinia tenebrosa]|uniref:ditrans,polycis-polyprenyl diphosphate synthase [(2E,6E)-farnesyldiphosphate specific] n=1 Tax=Actinia tenebrosa TaxID=6105 RepID=A0A6P8IKK8_ACTTE|nr:dehydrodolichyl diphosphate synthase complex subunit nus1-like [Actinia tenebrosa]
MWLYRLLLGFIHFILYIRFIISAIALKIQLLATGVFGSRGTSLSEIHLHSKNFTKLPLHISFLVLEPEISFEDVAKLIVWSMAMGISYISIYDRKGVFKKKAAKLSTEVIHKQKEIFNDAKERYTFVIRTKSTKFDQTLAPKQVCISLLSEADGKEDIIEAAQDFCLEIQRKETLPKHMNEDVFDQMLKATHGTPDTDLALKFGNVPMLMGYLPWQTRLTEFISYRTHHAITFSTYLGSLRQYDRCEKRFGK